MLTKTDFKQIEKIVKSSELRIGKRIDKLERKLDYAINFLDREHLKLLHRVEVIEEHLGIRPTTP